MHQIVDLRGRGTPIRFDSASERAAYDREVNELRARLPRGQFAVAPRIKIQTKRGELEAGSLLTVDDLDDERDVEGYLVALAAHRWHRLVRDGFIVEVY